MRHQCSSMSLENALLMLKEKMCGAQVTQRREASGEEAVMGLALTYAHEEGDLGVHSGGVQLGGVEVELWQRDHHRVRSFQRGIEC